MVPTTGVLIIAHGSRKKSWIHSIDEIAATLTIPLPIKVGFLELVEGRSIADGVRELEHLGVARIIVVPLFVCSGSTHLEEIQYALGLKSTSRIETDLPFIHPQAEIVWSPPMDDHPYIFSILNERVLSLSVRPQEESLLLVAHGSDKPGFQELWERSLYNLSSGLQKRFGFQNAGYATLLPDTVVERAHALGQSNNLIVIPAFLSQGYFTSQVIPDKLADIPYRYNGETYLPHPLASKWIEESVMD